MQPRFDFAAFYQNDKLSDCSLLIRIDGDVKQRLPGHGIVLSNGEQLLYLASAPSQIHTFHAQIDISAQRSAAAQQALK